MKRFICALTAFLLISTVCFAEGSVLGTLITCDEGIEVSEGTVYSDNIFYSDQSGVGRQHERFYTYTPGGTTVPAVYSGEYIYGKQTLGSATDEIRKQGLIPLMGMNAGFFSMQTGVPMSNVIENGVIIAKETSGADAVGFYEDGTAVVNWLKINTVMKIGETDVVIANINKYRQPFGAYLLTDRFYKNTKAKGEGLNIVIGSVSGEMRLGETVTGVVESKSKDDGEIDIPAGKLVLTIDDESITNGYGELYNQLDSLNVGDEVSFTSTVANPDVWNNISYAVGSVGGRLIKEGVLQDVDDSAAPRTAVGIKADGSVVFYTIDGRQDSSYGVRLKTLGKRLLELGCVEAVNFDGGGSTTLNGIMPGDWHSTLLNFPSDGSQRPCTNFFILLNKAQQTSSLSRLYIYPYNGYYLTGESETFKVKGVDDGFYPVNLPAPVSFSVDREGCSIDKDGNAVFTGSGVCTVTAVSGEVSASVKINVVDSPDDVVFQTEETWKNIYSLSVSRGEKVELSVVPFYKHTEHYAEDALFTWEISEGKGLAHIDEDGTFIAGNKAGKGKVKVTFGSYCEEIPFTVRDDTPLLNGGNYSEAEFSFENGLLSCIFTNSNNIPMSWATLYIDGKKAESSFDGKTLTAVINDDSMHKIKVLADNVLGTKTLAYYTVNGAASDCGFTDITDHWAQGYISFMTHHAVTDYTYESESENFFPDTHMTRLDFAVMTAKALGYNIDEYSGVQLDFIDNGELPESVLPYVKALVSEKIISGKGSDEGAYFAPFDTITRAEVAAIIGRTMPYGIKSGSISATDSDEIPDWAVAGFNVLTRYNIISGYPDGSVKPGNNITRAECVRILYEIF